MTQWLAAAVLAAALGLAGARAAEAQTLETKLIKDDKAARLAVYSAECKDDYWECVIADVGCATRGEFAASFIGLSSREAGAWLAREEGAASVDLGRERVALRATKLELSDASGDWDVSFSGVGDASRIWRETAASGTLSLSMAGRTVTFPRTGATNKALRELAKLCAPE